MCVYRSFRNRPQLSPLPFPHFFSPRSAGNSASTFLLTIFASAFSLARRTQKFINKELLCDGRNNGKVQRGRRAAPASRSKNNGESPERECGRVRKLRTAKNAGEIEETGKPWRMVGERPKQREDKRRYWGEVIPEGS